MAGLTRTSGSSLVSVEYQAEVVLDVPGEPGQAVAAVEQSLTDRDGSRTRTCPK